MEPSIWTEPVLNDLRKLAEARFSASKIAAQLCCNHGISVTRSAVIGKAFRAEITLRQGKSQPRQRMSRDEANRRRRDHHTAGKIHRLSQKLERRHHAIANAPQVDLIASGKRKALLQLTPHCCRWPIGTPGEKDFMFCGNEKLGELPYCPGHARIAYRGRP